MISSLRGLLPPLRDDPIDDRRVYEPRANAHAGHLLLFQPGQERGDRDAYSLRLGAHAAEPGAPLSALLNHPVDHLARDPVECSPPSGRADDASVSQPIREARRADPSAPCRLADRLRREPALDRLVDVEWVDAGVRVPPDGRRPAGHGPAPTDAAPLQDAPERLHAEPRTPRRRLDSLESLGHAALQTNLVSATVDRPGCPPQLPGDRRDRRQALPQEAEPVVFLGRPARLCRAAEQLRPLSDGSRRPPELRGKRAGSVGDVPGAHGIELGLGPGTWLHATSASLAISFRAGGGH